MKKTIFFLVFGVSFNASAQFVVGAGGMTVQAGAILTVDGLVLQPSASFTLISNEVKRSTTPIGSRTGATGINRVYQLTIPPAFTGTAGFFYNVSELGPNIESMLKLAYESGTNWTTASGSTLNTTTKFISQTFTGTTISRLTATSASTPLPISLLQFNANKQNNRQALLKWTINEAGSAHSYEVQRSKDGKQFNNIGVVAATGRQEYMFTDELPGGGLNYYRLKMIAGNMDVGYSPVRQLIFNNGGNRVIIAPNPASNELAINIPDELVGQEAKVYDMTGNLISHFILSGVQTSVSISSWLFGLYFLKIGNGWSFKFEKR